MCVICLLPSRDHNGVSVLWAVQTCTDSSGQTFSTGEEAVVLLGPSAMWMALDVLAALARHTRAIPGLRGVACSGRGQKGVRIL